MTRSAYGQGLSAWWSHDDAGRPGGVRGCRYRSRHGHHHQDHVLRRPGDPSGLPLLRVRLDHVQVGRPLRGVPGVGHAWPRRPQPRPGPKTVASAPTRSVAQPIGEIDVDTAQASPTGISEFDRVLGGGHRPRRRGAPRRRAGRRQVDPAARRREHDRPRWPQGPVHHGRGVRGAGAAARRADRRARPEPAARGRDRPRAGARPDRGDRPRPADRRLGPDHRVRAGGRLPRRRQPGPGGRRRAHRRGQGTQHACRARRARHQGRLGRRPPHARAPGRRGAAVRGRPPLAPAHGARRQEPVRADRRGRLLRAHRGRHHRSRRPERAVLVAHQPRRARGPA